MEDDPSIKNSPATTCIAGETTEKKPAPPCFWGSACFFFCLSLILASCGKKSSDVAISGLDTVLFSTFTTDVNTLISDSGITKYKLRAKYWYTYEKPDRRWVFPKGIYLEQFDTDFNIEASVEADSAIYYQDKRLWELDRNVRVMNRNGQHFFAETLFWDEASGEVYSSDPVRIERSKGEYLYAEYGFKSNQTMTKYELYSSSGHMDVRDDGSPSPMLPPTGSAPDTTRTKEPAKEEKRPLVRDSVKRPSRALPLSPVTPLSSRH